jgi:dipeptidyl aminopeptidase/acylaminoacyl peptidase
VYEYDIERYLNVRSAFGASFRADGTLSFRMNTTGTPQVWTVPEPGGWPTQRTFYDERVTFASPSPERIETVFGMDEGGNERQRFFRLDDDGRVRSLTTAEAKHRWGGWSHDGDRFAFASNRRDQSVFDIYVQGRTDDAEDAERVLEGDGWLSVSGWSPDDSRLLVHEARSNFDQDVFVLDIESEEVTHLTDDADDVRYKSLSWGPDGESVYCCSDQNANTLELVRLDAETGALSTVESGGEWNVDGVAIDDETGRIVYSRNVDGYTELTVGDIVGEGIEHRSTPDVPAGVAGGVSFDDGAERFAVTVTADTINTNVYVVDVDTGDAERWTHAPTAGIPESTFVEAELVRYETFDGREIPGYLSVPQSESKDGFPVVVDIHGGPESQRRPSFSPVKQYFLSHGYAVFEPNVRGSTGYGRDYAALDDVEKRMDSVADLEAAAAWLTEHPAIDGDRLIAKGGSYGGFMTLAALTEYPERWAAGIDIVGIANFVTFLENTGSWRRELREAEYGSLEGDRELLESISPIHSVERIEAPLFVLHGANDPRVPLEEAEQVAERAREAGVPVRTLVFEDEGHGFSKLENRIEAYSAIVEFLEAHV